MRKIAAFCALWFGFAGISVAQQFPKWEFFAGYSHDFADVSRSKVDLNGFHVSLGENVNKWLGGIVDFSAHFQTVNGMTVDSETLGFGPRVAYRKSESFTPSAHVALGIVHGSQGFLGNSTSGTHFAVIAGGALDYKWSNNVAIRIVQADLVRTKFQNLSRNNVQLAIGVVWQRHE